MREKATQRECCEGIVAATPTVVSVVTEFPRTVREALDFGRDIQQNIGDLYGWKQPSTKAPSESLDQWCQEA